MQQGLLEKVPRSQRLRAPFTCGLPSLNGHRRDSLSVQVQVQLTWMGATLTSLVGSVALPVFFVPMNCTVLSCTMCSTMINSALCT